MLEKKRLFGTNGIRGLVNKELTPELAIKIGTAIGTFFGQGTVVLGYDARTSGPMLAKALTAGITSTGCNVSLAGMAPTPTLQYAVKRRNPAGGVIVTASHNPPEYNGIKVISSDGIEIPRKQEIEIEKIFFNEKFRRAKWDRVGTTREVSGVIDDYVEAIKTHVEIERIRKKGYHVLVDGANSVGSLTCPLMLRQLGCKVTTINANIDGTFPSRLPEPRPENLQEFAVTTKAVNADLGVAFDGDADRSVFADENGKIHWGDVTFALAEKFYLMQHKDRKIVTPVSSSNIVKDIADEYGGEIIWTKVGSVTVSNTMKEVGSELGGEENGGIFYGPHIAVRDGTMATALMLDLMAKTGKKFSALIEEMPKYYIEKAKIDCPEAKKESVLKMLRQHVSDKNVSTIDGVKIWFEDKSAILIRPSGTEPIYRLYAEARNQTRAAELIREYTRVVKKILQKLP